MGAMASAANISLMTFNIRYANQHDGLNRWDNRRDEVIGLVNRYRPTVMGTQEGLMQQLTELHEGLHSYERFGNPREKDAEYCQIFYDTSYVKRLDGGNFWLSETPDTPSGPAWGAGCVRVTTWCKFALKDDPDRVFYVFNTHLDHQSVEAQKNGASVMQGRIRMIAPEATVFVMGDFNTYRRDAPYKMLVDDLGYGDAWINSTTSVGKVSYTYHAWLGLENPKEIGATVGENHIDFILYSPAIQVKVNKTEVITESRRNKLQLSDHFPVYTEVNLGVEERCSVLNSDECAAVK